MSKWICGALLLLTAGAAQGCYHKCDFKDNGCDPECIDRSMGESCMDPDPGGNTTTPQPGVLEKLAACMGSTARLTIPSPFFTVRTFLPDGTPVVSPNPRKCQPFDVIWNVCNEGGVTFPATDEAYQVNLIERVPPGGNPGLLENLTPDLPDLEPCACTQGFFVSSGLQCSEPTVNQNQVDITSNLTQATGGFHVVP